MVILREILLINIVYHRFLFGISKLTHNGLQNNKIKGQPKLSTTQKHDLVTPYMTMEVTRGSKTLMASPTSIHPVS